MPSVLSNTPLSALEAVVLDTETTGLDVKTARVIEIGLFGQGHDLSWDRLLNPGISIPAASTRVHGIDDFMVRDAEGFRETWPVARDLIGTKPVIGHSLGFDLAILKRECERSGTPWRELVWLDTRLLASVLEAKLPDFALNTLSGWLDLSETGMHRALEDARTTAAIFTAMIPRLRERGIHTFGEALSACRKLDAIADDLARAGWTEAPSAIDLGRREAALLQGQDLGGFDAFPFQQRVGSLMSSPPHFTGPDTRLDKALAIMADRKISCLFVGAPEAPSAEAGILTERDGLRALVKTGAAALSQPIDRFASRPLVTIPEGAFAYRAIGRMARLGIRHLAVVSENHSRVTGALSQRDLLRMRAQSAIVLGDDVDTADSVAALGRAWAKLPALARLLSEEGIDAPGIAQIIAREVGALTRRAAILAAERMAAAGQGAAPCSFAVVVLGSAGRGESLLAMDQDNAIVFSEGGIGGEQDRWFAQFGRHIADILHEVGVPYCTGGVMASEPAFRGSVATWLDRLQTWLRRSSPNDLLNVDIVFDARTVHGDPALMNQLLTTFRSSASENPAFLKLLTASHGDNPAPLRLLGGLKGDDDGRIDLKRHLISRIVAAARVLALRHGQVAAGTRDRLFAVEKLGIGSSNDLKSMADAFSRGQHLVLRAQLSDIAHGRPPGNRVPLSLITSAEKTSLKHDIALVSDLGELVKSAMF
jgi:CBS domain-containing protein